MRPEEIKEFLRGLGYMEDRFGHMKKEFPNTIRRYKFQKISVRVEVKARKSNSRWFSESYLKPIYYKDLEIKDGKLRRKLKNENVKEFKSKLEGVE